MGRGKDTLYTPELADEILERHSNGETLTQICRDDHMPARTTVIAWVNADREGFCDRYKQSHDLHIDFQAEELDEIANDGRNDWMDREIKAGRIVKAYDQEAVARSRLRVDTIKWKLSKLKPEKYGERLNLTGDLNLTTKTDEQLHAEAIALAAKSPEFLDAIRGAAAGGDPAGDRDTEETA